MFLRYKYALLAHMGDFVAELQRYLPRLSLAVIQVDAAELATPLNRGAEADERALMQCEDVLDDWWRRWAAVRARFTAYREVSRPAELATRTGVSSAIALLRQIPEVQRGGSTGPLSCVTWPPGRSTLPTRTRRTLRWAQRLECGGPGTWAACTRTAT